MRANHYTLTPALVHHHARQRLQAFVPLADFSPLCPAPLVWPFLLAAAGARRSFSATCQRLRDAPSDETVRKALHATLTDRTRLQWQLNRALRGHLPKALKRKPQVIACDLHLIPYYGKPCRDDKELCRSRSQAGTTHFHSYATAYIVRAGQRFTVGLTYRTQGTPIRDLLKGLLQQVRRAGIRIKYVLLDRGFYSVAAIRYLQAARTPFMMPAKFSGRKPKPGQAP